MRATSALSSRGAPGEGGSGHHRPSALHCSGNRFVGVAMDYFTKWLEAHPLPNHEAISVAEVLVNEYFSRWRSRRTALGPGERIRVCRLQGVLSAPRHTEDSHHSPKATVRWNGRTLQPYTSTKAGEILPIGPEGLGYEVTSASHCIPVSKT